MKKTKTLENKLLIGRSEWCHLPQLHLSAIKAKIDTGAKTSALHAINITPYKKNGKHYVSFDVHPLQNDKKTIVHCRAQIVDQRNIMSSNGHKEKRYVISTKLKLGSNQWPIELTLSDRDPLRFRLLLGREALNKRVIIDPSVAYNQGKFEQKALKRLYSLLKKIPKIRK